MSDMGSAQSAHNPGLAVAGFVISWLGCFLGLSLLQRRTSIHGRVNWFILLGAAAALGGVGLWSGHCMNNRAIQMPGGPESQILFNILGTLGAFFCPIILLGLTLYAMNDSDKFSRLEVAVNTLMTTASAMAMFTISEAEMVNYRRVSISGADYAAAVLIMLGANLAAFSIYFYCKANWTSVIRMRPICAGFLAASVSAMQWMLKRRTQYRFIGNPRNNNLIILSRKSQTIVPVCLGAGCLVGLFVLLVIGCRSRRRASGRIPQVLLACAFFDSENRLMVTPEGCVPCQKITYTGLERGFDDLFDINHPLFCWLYRASFCWSAIKDEVHRIPEQVEATRAAQTLGIEVQPSNSENLYPSGEDDIPDRSLLFRLLFLSAAQNLARITQQPLERIGTLFGSVVDTGTIRKPAMNFFGFQISMVANLNDNQPSETWNNDRVFGRGQALFLVRSVSSQDSKELKAAGYRFANPERILPLFANDMEMTQAQASRHLQQMQRNAAGERALAPGVHLACLVIRPELRRGLGILVKKEARNVLPTTQLPMSKLEPWHERFILRLDGFTLAQCVEQLHIDYNGQDERQREFAAQMLRAVVDLRTQVDHPMFARAVLSATPLEAPSGIPGESSPLHPAVILAFRILLDIHPAIPLNREFMFQPWRFFACQQRVYQGYPHHGAFVHHMRQEIQSLSRNDVPAARQSAMARAQKNFHRLSRTAMNRIRFDSSRWTLPSTSTFTLNRFRSHPGDRNVNAASIVSTGIDEAPIHIYEMLRTRPTVLTRSDHNDISPLDNPTYVDILMKSLAQARSPSGMVRVEPSF